MNDYARVQKKSFVLYNDLIYTVKKLDDQQTAQFFRMILAYVNGEVLNTDDPLTDLAFTNVKLHLDRNFEKWEEIRKKRSEAGKLGGRPKKAKKQSKAKKANALSGVSDSISGNNSTDDEGSKKSKKAKKAVSVNTNNNNNINNPINTNINNAIEEKKEIESHLWDGIAQNLFGMNFRECDSDQQDTIKEYYIEGDKTPF